MIFLCAGIIIWSFLEASFWWVAPDISISIAYVHFPQHWKRFVILALAGAFIGSVVTYLWAYEAPASWLHYVSGMRFHSGRNIQYVRSSILSDSLGIVKAAWGGIPYKLFFGIAPTKDIAFTTLISLGLLSRSIRFLFTLGVTSLIRHYSRPWSIRHPTQLSVILLAIWALMISVFDIWVNNAFV